MKKIIRPRQAGKSSELIRIAEETNAYIIVATRARAVCLADMAKKQGRHILYPVTLREYEQFRFRGSYIRHVLIDDADAVLEQIFKEVKIDAITMTECVMEQEPSEDVKPVAHAHWDVIDADSEGDEAFVHTWATLRCSRCGLERTVEDDYVPQYCEDCGAKMDEEENETMNKVVLMGRLTRDPDVKYTQGPEQKCKARYTLAVDRRKARDSEGQQADFISCVAFGKSGEFVEKYCHKGTKLVVSGRIQTGSYTNRDGQKVYTTDVVAEEQEFAESKNAGNGEKGNTAPGQQADQQLDMGFMDIPDGEQNDLPYS